jgi:ferredoxin, 2Fe-2S
VIVKNGLENLSDMDDDEADGLDKAEVEIPLWNRNYVSEGGGSMNFGDAIPAGKR